MVYTRFHGITTKSQDISLKTTKLNLMVVLKEKSATNIIRIYGLEMMMCVQVLK